MERDREKAMLTIRQVAHILNVHVNTVRQWSNQGLLQAHRINSRGDRRFLREDINRFLSKGGEQVVNTYSLGKILRERREIRGWTLRQLSSETGVSAAHIARAERGERFPSARILRMLSQPLGFGEAELLKLAGFLSRDDSDSQISRLKEGIKLALMGAIEKIDSL